MEASSAGKREYGAKEDKSNTGGVWAAVFHHVTAHSHMGGVLKLKNLHVFNFNFFSDRAEPRILEAHLYVHFGVFLICFQIFWEICLFSVFSGVIAPLEVPPTLDNVTSVQ
jgi:hypothetical protein